MPAAAKLINVLGALAKLETTYGTAVTLTTTADGLLLQYPDRNVGAPVSLNYSFDGQVGVYPGNLGSLPLSPPGGKSFSGDLPVRFKGSGTTYSTTVTPGDPHLLLQIAGFSASFGSSTWTYTPTPATTAYKSASMGLYARGELWPLKGVVANWSFTADGPAPPTHTFAISGIANGDVTDVTLPTVTYTYTSVTPPAGNGVTLVLGAFTTNAVAYNIGFNMNRVIEPRVALTSGTGHEGFIPGGINPQFTCTVEDTAFVGSPYHTSAGLDPILLKEAATAIAVSAQFGSSATNRWKVASTAAQLLTVVPSSSGRAATWDLTFQFPGEDCTVTFG